ncbi:hypothetical protein [Azospirillum sp. BE72]|uniref:hypothetical protein n=1 Tax=Azospirillum sp. BE72 TaxID=2817776 RepID=UPI002862422A|nr:hypothetical protein [Azospirillum sp. BE72]MDR6773570.1 hypothetical protein [Azospirillum sp. BE72]
MAMLMTDEQTDLLRSMLATLQRIEKNTETTANVAKWFKERAEHQQKMIANLANLPRGY